MAFESEYKTDDVAATPVAADKIDGTFRSSTIGEYKLCFVFTLCSECTGGRYEALRHCVPVKRSGNFASERGLEILIPLSITSSQVINYDFPASANSP